MGRSPRCAVAGYSASQALGVAAGFLGVSAPAATKSIDKLVRMGLLVRRPSGADRRVQLISASATGRRLVDRCERLRLNRLKESLSAFPPQEIEILSHLLERFAVALYGAGRIDGGFCLRCAADVQGPCPIAPLRGGCPYQNGRPLRVAMAQPSAVKR